MKRSKRIHKYRGTQDKANSFWKVCEDENTKIITYQIDAENSLLASLVQELEKNGRHHLLEYLKELALNLPINHIYEKMAERPRDVSQNEADIAALEALLEKVFES